MLRLTIKNMVANRIRFALTTLGVVLAVSFVVSAFVLGDGLRASFTEVSENITDGIDLELRPVSEVGVPEPLTKDAVALVAAVDGVADAVANIEAAENAVRPVKSNGESIPTQGPPQLAFNWIDNEQLNPFSMVEGAPPDIGEFVIDFGSAARHDFVTGESYELLTPSGRTSLILSGTSSFGQDNSTLGAVLMQMNTTQAGELFAIDGISTVDIQVRADADIATVRAAVAAAVPDAEVVNNATVLDETTSAFTEEVDIVSNILLGFGGVALFVSTFIIYNTFAIVVGQRSRELGLLRAIGAGRAQLRRSVLGEALIVGAVASVAGIGGGIGVAKGLEALLGAAGVEFPDYPLILATRTIVAAVVIGIGVTMVAAISPARRASTVPPIAALRGVDEVHMAGSARRKVVGLGLFGIGVVAGFVGLTGVGSTTLTIAGVAVGAVGVFLGVTVLSPTAVGPVTALVAWPVVRVAGVTGRLARQNAARNPGRTATTAAALMVGLALVSTALIVGESVKTSLSTTLERVAMADYYITDQLAEVHFPSGLAEEIREDDLVIAAGGFSSFEARIDGEIQDVASVEFAQLDGLLDLNVRERSQDQDASTGVLISTDEAAASELRVGDILVADFATGLSVQATIAGTFSEQALIEEDYLFDTAGLNREGLEQPAEWVALTLAPGADPGEVAVLLAGLSDEFPQAAVETVSEFRQRLEGFVDDILAIVNVLVALAVVIALIGIANTLALSTFERTRELGLLRAVGMSRRQLRRMVRLEAAMIATFGAILGVAVGVLFGWGVVTALPDTFVSTLSVPASRIVVLVVVAAVAGVIAAWLPARRAGRLNVLDAISL